MFYASRMAMCRALIPKLAYDNHTLEFYYTGNASASFDPTLTTSQSTTVIWQPDDAPATVTTGTSHAYSYVPGSGARRCKATVVGGLGLVTGIDCNTDAITAIKNLEKSPITSYKFYGTSNVFKYTLSSLNKNATYLDGAYNPGVSGSLADLGSAYQYIYLYPNTGIIPASVAHLTAIRDLRIYSLGWLAADVDLVIDSIYQAVVANANHFTFAGPIILQIGGSGGTANAAPSGVYQEATPPTTGLEKVYYLCHLASHAWAITWNGGSGP